MHIICSITFKIFSEILIGLCVIYVDDILQIEHEQYYQISKRPEKF